MSWKRDITSYSFDTIQVLYIQLRIKNFVAITIKIKNQNLKIFTI